MLRKKKAKKKTEGAKKNSIDNVVHKIQNENKTGNNKLNATTNCAMSE